MNLEAEITRLTQEWYCLANEGHHKDRDCHWYIEAQWSYGDDSVYVVQHYGYLVDDKIEVECRSYEAAQQVLISRLQEEIAKTRAKRDRLRAEDPNWRP